MHQGNAVRLLMYLSLRRRTHNQIQFLTSDRISSANQTIIRRRVRVLPRLTMLLLDSEMLSNLTCRTLEEVIVTKPHLSEAVLAAFIVGMFGIITLLIPVVPNWIIESWKYHGISGEWHGDLIESSADFRTRNNCTFHIVISNIRMSASVTPTGNLHSALLTYHYKESTETHGCKSTIGETDNVFRADPIKADVLPNALYIEYAVGIGNRPDTVGRFMGTLRTASCKTITGTLVLERIDQKTNFPEADWRQELQFSLSR